MDPRDFQRLAGVLAAREGAGPAQCRTAISRAYYAAYHVALDAIEQLGVTIRRGRDAHMELQAAWCSIEHPIAREIGSRLGHLHSKRIVADYRLPDRGCEEIPTARVYVEIGGALLTTLGRVLEAPTRSELAEAIRRRAEGAEGQTKPRSEI